MWVKVLFILGTVLIGFTLSDNNSKCDIDGISDLDWVVPIPFSVYDNEIDLYVFQHNYTGNIDNLACSCEVCKDRIYVEFNKNDTYFYAKTTDALKNFDDDMIKYYNDSSLLYTCTLTCAVPAVQSQLVTYITIKDYNDYKPEFEKTNLIYKVASPLMPESDFTVYGDAIKATDRDFSNTDITFTVTPDDFDVISVVDKSTKPNTFVANFRAKRVVQVTEANPRNYIITATDSGIVPGPLSNTLNVTLQLNPSMTVETPEFIYPDPSSTFSYQYEENNTLTMLRGPIKVGTVKPDLVGTSLKLTGDYSTHFNVSYDKTTSEVSLAIASIIDIPPSEFIFITLHVETDSAISTPIPIYFSSVISSGPKFSKKFYTASYDDTTNEVSLDDTIKVTSTEEPTVTVSDTYKDRFSMVLNKNDHSYTVHVDKPLTVEEIQKLDYLTVTIEATDGTSKDTAGILISLPSHNLVFTEILYTATYNSDNTITVDSSKPIAFIPAASNVNISVEPTYSTYFGVKEESGKYAMNVITPLPKEILNSTTEITVTLTAKDKFNNQAKSVVKLSLPKQESAPIFSKPYYVVQYYQNNTEGYIDFSTLGFDNVDDSKVKIGIDADYRNNFEVAYDSSKWRIDVKTPLDDNMFRTNSELTLTMEATAENVATKGTGVLVIELQSNEAPKFISPYYTAQYEEGQNGSVDFNTAVAFANAADNKVAITLLGDHSENFEVIYDLEKWKINIKTPLDNNIFSTNSELVLTMEATTEGVTAKGTGVLVIELESTSNNDEAPKFANTFYIAQYEEDQTGSIDFNTDISFTNTEYNKVTISLLGEYSENFEVVYKSNKWIINIITPLDNNIFEAKSELVLTLEAALEDVTPKGTSVLVIELNDDDAPKFHDPFYTVQYEEGQNAFINFSSPLSFTNTDDAKVTITLSDYTNNFEVVYDSGSKKWRINIKIPLDSNIFQTKSELVVTMEATEEGVTAKGTGVLVIELKSTTNDDAPKFADTFYTALYEEGHTGIIDFNKTLSFTNAADDKVTIALSGAYSENFEVVYESKKWTIKIKTQLDSNIFKTTSQLVLTMDATKEGVTAKGTGVLVMELKSNSNDEVPKFDKSFYEAKYEEGQSGPLEFNTPPSITNYESDKVTITLDAYTENFEVVYDSTKWVIKINKQLDSTIFNTTSQLILTMEATAEEFKAKGTSVLVIELKSNSDTGEPPNFVDPYYTAQYEEGHIGYIDINPSISFTNADVAKVTIALNDYKDNFNLVYNGTAWRINITKPLESDIFNKNSQLILTMEATTEGVKNSGTSVLVIELKSSVVNNNAPKFADPYYVVEYKENQTGAIDFATPISFTNAEDTAVKIVLGEYSENFEVKYEDSKWHLVINKPLDAATFSEMAEIVTKMEATAKSFSEPGVGVLVIKLISGSIVDNTPKFTDPYYTVQYSKNQTGYIEFNPALSFKNVNDNNKVEIILSDYTDNFEVLYESAKWHIKIKKILDPEIFSKNAELVITMEATEEGVEQKGIGVLVIKLIDGSNVDNSPQFNEPYYTVQYGKDQSGYIEFASALSFKNIKDNSKVTITLSDYTDNFEVLYESSKWHINIKKVLEPEIFSKNAELVVTMEATEEGVEQKGIGVLVIKLIDGSNVDNSPQFNEPYYTVQYGKDQSGYIEFASALSFRNIKDNSKVTITLSDYTDNFEVLYESSKWHINIKKALDPEIFSKSAELVVTMEATEEGVEQKGIGVLVIKLIDGSNVDNSPQFNEPYYTVQYGKDQSGYIEFASALSFKNIKDNSKVTITLSDYTDNFEVLYESSKWHINIKKALEPEIFSKNAELVITMEATEEGVEQKGIGVLVIKLIDGSNVDNSPQFNEPYYTVQLGKDQSGYIEFASALSFKNIKDNSKVTITLSDYTDNFEVLYESSKWHINIKKALEPEIFSKNAELVVTMEATEEGVEQKGIGVLVIKLIDGSNVDNSPQFNEPYYTVQYGKDQSGYIEFASALSFKNIKDNSKVTITLSDYSDNFEVLYESAKWHIKIKKVLDPEIFSKNAELVITMQATEEGVEQKGIGVLVIRLLDGSNVDNSPQFNEPYYTVQYGKDQSGYIEFSSALSFKNIKDNSKVTITLSDYTDNFEVLYESSKWHIKIKKALDPEIFSKNAELVVTMEATEKGVEQNGIGVLVIRLLDGSNVDNSPQFNEPYYTVQYGKDQSGYIEFDSALSFKNINDNSEVTITLSDYTDNFEVLYESSKWHINIKKALDPEIFSKNAEIVVTMEAIEQGVEQKGIGVLVIRLIDDSNVDNTPKFNESYYIVQYSKGQTGYIDFDTTLSFKNVDDISKVTIGLAGYIENFHVEYEKDKWQIKILKPLDDSIFETKTDLVTTMAASEQDISSKGIAVLVIELIGSSIDAKVPKFKDSYYKALYPKTGSGTFFFENDLAFENVDDISKVSSISVLNYTKYFDVVYEETSKKWQINILKKLDDSILNSGSYLVATLSANIEGNINVPSATFVLNFPTSTSVGAPVFTKSYYKAAYTVSESNALVTFEDLIGFTNEHDMSRITIASDEYSKYFRFAYSDSSWHMTSPILDTKVFNKTNLVVSVTATDLVNKLEGYSVIDLQLPTVNTNGAPIFSQTYYTGSYLINGDVASVALDKDINFLNKKDMSQITITTVEYAENFNFSYTGEKWIIKIKKNLDQSVLNAKVDIAMNLIAKDKSNPSENGQSALLLKLPVINDDEAPKFSKISYSSPCTPKTEVLDSKIEITNKPDLRTVSILEDSYKSNFEVTFNDTEKAWFIKVISMPVALTSGDPDLVLTLTATDNGKTGQAALILTNPLLVAPKLSKDQYYGTYIGEGDQLLDVEEFSVDNKDQDKINMQFSSVDGDFSDNFQINYDNGNKVWKMTGVEPIKPEILETKTELVFTLTATEEDNDNEGRATLIITKNKIEFTEQHYVGKYDNSGSIPAIILEKNIQLTSSKDTSSANVKLQSSDEFDPSKYFTLTLNSDHYEITVQTPLPSEILLKQSLVITLEADLGATKSYSTLIVNLPSQSSDKSIQFSSALYNGEYKVPLDGGVEFNVETATIVTNDAGDVIDVNISDSAYAEYFALNITGTQVGIIRHGDLPLSIYAKDTNIPLTLIATIAGTSITASSVVNIKIIYELLEVSVEFDSYLYNGKYEINGSVPKLTVDPITLYNFKPEKADHIEVTITNVYQKFFSVTFNNPTVTLSLDKNMPDDYLVNNSVIISLEASFKGTSVRADAVVNLRIINDDNPVPDTGIIAFNSVSNTAQYSLQGNKGVFKLDKDIGLTTDYTTEEIVTDIYDELGLKDCFKSSYSNQQFKLEKIKDLPSSIFNSRTFAPITLTATVTGTSKSADAVLSIQLNKNDPNNGNLGGGKNKTSYVIAISILVVLIILLIAAAIAYWYFKIRHPIDDRMTEEEYMNRHVKFDKSIPTRASGDKMKRSSAIEERRPTGFIFNASLKENEPRESTTDPENRERRKSVAFDENVEKMQIESANDEDLEKGLNRIPNEAD